MQQCRRGGIALSGVDCHGTRDDAPDEKEDAHHGEHCGLVEAGQPQPSRQPFTGRRAGVVREQANASASHGSDLLSLSLRSASARCSVRASSMPSPPPISVASYGYLAVRPVNQGLQPGSVAEAGVGGMACRASASARPAG